MILHHELQRGDTVGKKTLVFFTKSITKVLHTSITHKYYKYYKSITKVLQVLQKCYKYYKYYTSESRSRTISYIFTTRNYENLNLFFIRIFSCIFYTRNYEIYFVSFSRAFLVRLPYEIFLVGVMENLFSGKLFFIL